MTDEQPSPWAPLRHPTFRMLWGVSLVSSICMWMNDVTAAWVMTSIGSSARMVALVQTASSLPIFLLGLPSGALADLLDRRRCYIATQVWATGVALVACIGLALGYMTPMLLLALTFANGTALAMRWPVTASLVPQTVPRSELSGALALNSVGFNTSRIAGPLMAGALIASFGSVYVFAINAALSAAATVAILCWKHPPEAARSSPSNLGAAIRTGLRFVRQSARMRDVLLRMSLFFMNATALVALLPLVARQMHGSSAATFTVLLAAMGGGAVLSVVFVLPRARASMSADLLLGGGTLLMSAATVLAALTPYLAVGVVAMLAAGVAWTTVANSLTVLAQLALPDWVRARGMSIQLVCMMGSGALGAALWGQVATVTSVPIALCLCAVSSGLCMFAMRKRRLGHAFSEDVDSAKSG